MLKVLSKQPELRQWLLASRTTAQTRGLGFPQYRYHGNAADGPASIASLATIWTICTFRVRCGAISKWNTTFPVSSARDTQMVIGGWWVSPIYDLKTYAYGNYRGPAPHRSVVPPLTNVSALDSFPHRGSRRREPEFRQRSLTPHSEAVCPQRPMDRDSQHLGLCGTAQNVRITGRPQIPDEVCLSDHERLTGWLPYYEGMPGSPEQ